MDPRLEPPRVFRGHFQRGERDVARRRRAVHFDAERDGDGARAATHIENAPCTAARGRQCQRLFHDVFGFGPGDEYVGRD